MPVLNQYKQRHKVMSQLIFFSQNVGLFLGCLTVLILAGATGFAQGLTVILQMNGHIYGTEEELEKKKFELYRII